MFKNIYTIKDNKSGSFSDPFFMTHDAEAIRSIQQVVNDPKTTLHQYPEDFDLYNLGLFDDKGKFLELTQTHMVSCLSLKQVPNNGSEKKIDRSSAADQSPGELIKAHQDSK